MIRILLILLLMFSGVQAQRIGGVVKDTLRHRKWVKPDMNKRGRVYQDFDNDVKIMLQDTTSNKVDPSFTIRSFAGQGSPTKFKLKFMNTAPDSNWVRGDSFNVKDGNITHISYTKDNSFIWDILIQSLPDTTVKDWNVFSYDIETAGLNFYYQPAFTLAQLADSIIDGRGILVPVNYRPDSVVGSYAVYHKNKRDNRRIIAPNGLVDTTILQWQIITPPDSVGASDTTNWVDTSFTVLLDTTYENYKTGKAFHIFRPKVFDSASDTVWGVLNVDILTSKLTITVDPIWLKKATFPVLIDPTFGVTSGGATVYPLTGSVIGKYAPSSDGTLDSITYYTHDGWNTVLMTNVIYNSALGEPDTILGTSSTEYNTSANCHPCWVSLAMGDEDLVSGTDYFIGSSVDSARIAQMYDAADTGITYYSTSHLSNPWSKFAGDYPNEETTVYGTYTETASCASPDSLAGDGVGTNDQWVNTGGASDKWTAVNDNLDATYLDEGTVGEIQDITFEADACITSSVTVDTVIITCRLQESGGVTSSLTICTFDGTTADTIRQQDPFTGWTDYVDTLTTAPDGNAWDSTAIADLQMRFIATTIGFLSHLRVAEIDVSIIYRDATTDISYVRRIKLNEEENR